MYGKVALENLESRDRPKRGFLGKAVIVAGHLGIQVALNVAAAILTDKITN